MGNCLSKKPKTYRCGWCEKKITYFEIYSQYRENNELTFRFCSKECCNRTMMILKTLNNK